MTPDSEETQHEWDPANATGLVASAIALNRTVDALSDEELAWPSLLPGWSRAHVVAHLAMNGFAMAGVAEAIGRGRPVAMYESDAQRDGEIEELAQVEPGELRDRLLAATTAFTDKIGRMEADRWNGVYSRLPGGPTWPAVTLVATRRREVEIHHADLAAAYTRHDWPVDFLRELLDAVTVDHGASASFRVRATDINGDWTVGDAEAHGPTVMGRAADLGWWMTGRGDGSDLSCDDDRLPDLGPWHRASGQQVQG